MFRSWSISFRSWGAACIQACSSHSERESEGTHGDSNGSGHASDGTLDGDILPQPRTAVPIVEETNKDGLSTRKSVIASVSVGFNRKETVTNDRVGQADFLDRGLGIPGATPAKLERGRERGTKLRKSAGLDFFYVIGS